MIKLLGGVKDKLEAASVGTWKAGTGWNITIGQLPTKPDTAIAILLGPGLPANPKYLLDYPSVQVLVRGDANGYVDAANKAQLVKDVLLGLPSQTVSGDRWVIVTMIGDIIPLGFDEGKRPLFSANFQFTIEPATNAATNRIAL